MKAPNFRYWIESDPDLTNCRVVDFAAPVADPLGEGGKGFEPVFIGSFAECNAWALAHPEELA